MPRETRTPSDPSTDSRGDNAGRKAPPLLGPPTPPRGAEITGEKLLQASHELLYERMDSGASVTDICARAGTTVAMVKYCFGSKAGLFDALMERVMSQVSDELTAFSDSPAPPAEKLQRHVAGLIRNFLRYPYLNRFMNERLSTTEAGAVGEMSSRFAVAAREFYTALLDEGREQHGWRSTDPTLFFFTLIGSCEFVFAARGWLERSFGGRLDDAFLDEFTAHVTSMVLYGLQN